MSIILLKIITIYLYFYNTTKASRLNIPFYPNFGMFQNFDIIFYAILFNLLIINRRIIGWVKRKKGLNPYNLEFRPYLLNEINIKVPYF